MFAYIKKLFSKAKVEVRHIEVGSLKGLPRVRYWLPLAVNWTYRSVRLTAIVIKMHYKSAGVLTILVTLVIGVMAATPY